MNLQNTPTAKVLEMDDIMAFIVAGEIADAAQHNGRVTYTIDWEYSSDYGTNYTIEILKLEVDPEEPFGNVEGKPLGNLVEVPLMLVQKDIEFLKERIAEHEVN